MERYDEVLNFWFGGIDPDGPVDRADPNVRRWFVKNEKFDDEIRKNFKDDIDRAAAGDYKSWMEEPEGRLGLVILLDQFPRNIYRNTARAFEYDLKALEVSLRSIKEGYDEDLSYIQRVFLYMPLMHSEHMEVQENSLQYFRRLHREAQDHEHPALDYLQYTLDYAQRHYDIIKKFHRFPHRNKILKRRSTSEETAFLQNPGSSF